MAFEFEVDEGYNSNDDVNAILESMDIDRDFNVWNSFRSSMVMRMSVTPQGGAHPLLNDGKEARKLPHKVALSDTEKDEINKWDARIRRDEIYSRFYKATNSEQGEIKDVSILLGVHKKRGLGRFIGVGGSEPASAISQLLLPAENQVKSILLKRGPVLLLQEETHASNIKPSAINEHERELILLTRGFILAKIMKENSVVVVDDDKQQQQQRSSSSSMQQKQKSSLLHSSPKIIASTKRLLSRRKLIQRNFDDCEYLTSVTTVMDLNLRPISPGQDYDDSSFAVIVYDGTSSSSSSKTIKFACSTAESKDAWIRAFRESVVRAHINYSPSSSSSTRAERGWQHSIMVTSLFSAVFCDDLRMMKRVFDILDKEEKKEYIDNLDDNGLAPDDKRMVKKVYHILDQEKKKKCIDNLDDHGLTALHYAVMKNHLECAKLLLDAGCNPNVMDKEMRSPYYYAMENNNDAMMKLLQNSGASSEHADLSSELYGNAAQQQPPPSIEAKEKAARAQDEKMSADYSTRKKTGQVVANQMMQNMQGLQERGEKLEKLEDNTSDLKDNAESYKNMASELKNKMKKEATIGGWFGF